MPDYRIRRATLADLDALVHHRIAMFMEMGQRVDAPTLGASFRSWLATTMPPGEYCAWVCETPSGEIVAGGGISLLRWPPGPRAASADRLAFVYNVYTEPAHRKRGLARSLMETIHAWCAGNGIPAMALNAAADARHLYESLGYFEAPSPMMFKML
jgi:GNAT superfamily N-acetyltransferase